MWNFKMMFKKINKQKKATNVNMKKKKKKNYYPYNCSENFYKASLHNLYF